MQPSPSNTAGSLPKVRIVGFTGHRELTNPGAVADAVRAELAALRADGTQLIAMSSIAIGADMIFAREVVAAGIKWIVLLPKSEPLFQKDFTPEQWAEAQELMKKAADKRTMLGPDTPQAYVDCGKATVDDSDCLFAVWDGQPARGPGGTAEIINYARMLGRKVTLFRVDENRVEKNEPPIGPLEESEAEDILKLMGPPTVLPPAPRQLMDEFTSCDEKATLIAPHFRRNTLSMATLHLTATFLAGLGLSIEANHFPIHSGFLFVLSIAKFGCVLLALLILISLRQTRTHESWLQHRLAAEYCRSMLATWHCRDFIDPVSFEEEEELKGLAQSALFLRLEKDPNLSVDIYKFRTTYAHDRVMTQLSYFRREWEKADKKAQPLRNRYQYYTYSAVFFSLFIVGYRLYNFLYGEFTVTIPSLPNFKEACMTVLEVYPLLFPALASYMIARMGIDEIDRRLGRFADLKEKMRVALIDLYYCGSWESLSLSVERTEKILFNEVREWYSISWFSPNE